MPIGFTPDEVFPVKSSLDEHKPDDERVIFKVRAITVEQARTVRRLLDESLHVKTAEDENAKLNEAILIGVVGWENYPIPFSASGLDEALTATQKFILAREYPTLVSMSEFEKKVLRSQPISGVAPSAASVVGGSATTSPTN